MKREDWVRKGLEAKKVQIPDIDQIDGHGLGDGEKSAPPPDFAKDDDREEEKDECVWEVVKQDEDLQPQKLFPIFLPLTLQIYISIYRSFTNRHEM